MRNYEVTFIVDPTLSSDEIKATAQTYIKFLETEGCKIVYVDEIGLRQLAYPINKRSTGIYFCVEFECLTGEVISKVELALRRDEKILRFLTVKLDKYGVKYNDDKRNGLIGKRKKASNNGEKKEDIKKTKKVVASKPKPVAKPVAVAVTETVEEIKQEIQSEEE